MVPLLGLLAVFAHERRRRLESMLELSSAYRGTALVLGDVIEADDGYTGEHCKSVVALALDLAEHLNLGAERQRNLEFAALLHDVGKIAIPKEIINKPGKLDPHEWTIIKTHTLEGQKMLDRVGGFMREVGLIVRSHHERWDGGGYPDGLAGEHIPIEARIISCCDTWNAMRTDRPYRKALDYGTAEAELRSAAGTQLDPRLVESLLELVATEAEAEAEAAAAAANVPSVSPDAADAPQPRPAYGFAHPAC
jgi:putative nucleotidyltransferase with HDIG domain